MENASATGNSLRTPSLLSVYRCPACSESEFDVEPDSLLCRGCRFRYPVIEGVPFLFRPEDLDGFLADERGRPPMTAEAGTRSGGAYHWNEYRIEEILPDASEHPRVLLVGCGDAGERPYLEELGFDVAAFDIRRSTGTDFLADAHNLPLASGRFDVVLSMQVLEHLPRPWIAMGEMARVLRPGGWCVGSVAFLKAFHNSYFHMTHQALSVLLRDAGLRPEWFRGAQSLTYSLYGAMLPLGSRPLRRKLLSPVDTLLRWLRAKAWASSRKADPDEPVTRFHTEQPMSFRDFDHLRFAPAVVFKSVKE